jgi:hypothetical protein
MLEPFECRASALPLALLLMPAVCAQQSMWRDPSKHRVQFVTVEPGVSLEVLDGGGSGGPWCCLQVREIRRTCSTISPGS